MTNYSANLTNVWPSYLKHMTAAATYTDEYWHFNHSECRNTQIHAHKTSSTADLWHQPRLTNDIQTWSWGVRGINPAVSFVWLAVQFLKFKYQWIKRNVWDKHWPFQPSVQVYRRPCSLPPVNGHYGRLHRSTETIKRKVKLKRRCTKVGIVAPQSGGTGIKSQLVNGMPWRHSCYSSAPLGKYGDDDSTCCFPPHTLQTHHSLLSRLLEEHT